MTRLGRIRGWLFVVASLIAAAPLLADGSLVGTLAGRVRDESGGVLPGVTVELTSADKGFQRSAVSDSSGGFNFAVLPPGRYTVKATLQGFDTFESEGNVVTAEKITSVAVSLKLAKTAETVVGFGRRPAGRQDQRLGSDDDRLEARPGARRSARLPELSSSSLPE